MFSRMFYASCLTGLACGLLLTALQLVTVLPVITAAEGFEAPVAAAATAPTHADGHSHEHGEAWAPADGTERTLWTSVSNVVTAIGFSLLLIAVLAWRGRARVTDGLLWGAVGFAVFFAGPAIGLAPEIPGAFAAELADRQVWWFGTAVATAAGLGLLITRPGKGWKVLALVLLVVPHLVGAPHPDVVGGSAPQALAERFVVVAALTNAVFWLALGALSAVSYTRLTRHAGPSEAAAV